MRKLRHDFQRSNTISAYRVLATACSRQRRGLYSRYRGRQKGEAYGGEVRIVPYVSGVSTTGIIDSVIARYGADGDHV
jgi:hypothetical protein